MSFTSVNEQKHNSPTNPWKAGQSFAMARWLDQSTTDEPWTAARVTGAAKQQYWNHNERPGNARDTDNTSMKAENGSAKGM